jgi:hypothetical protein
VGGNGIASREPYSCSRYRYYDWFRRVRLLLLEVVRSGRGAGSRRIDGRLELGRQRSGQISNSWLRRIVLTTREPEPARKPKPLFWGFNHYEKLKHTHGGSCSGFRYNCIAGSKRGQNFGGNRSSGRDVASGKSIDWSWLGQLRESASAGERHWPEFRRRCRAAPVRARLGQNCER